jgi:predicted esterase
MQITFAHHARDLLVSAGLDVSYHESFVGHEIDVEHVDLCAGWLLLTLKANEIQDGQHA